MRDSDNDSTIKVKPDSEALWDKAWQDGMIGKIGRFQLREVLEEGDFWTVYKALDPRLDRDVAIKRLKPNQMTEEGIGRFFREARTAAKLNHPRIVKAYDVGWDEQDCWIAFQFIPGITLSRYVAQNSIDVRSAVRMIRDVADIIQYCHEQKAIHHDLKLSDILLDENGRLWLINVGLGHWNDHASDLTVANIIIREYPYMSIRSMANNSKKADTRPDIYSLAVMLIGLICDSHSFPFSASVPRSRIDILKDAPSLRKFNTKESNMLEHICLNALHPIASRRYQTMQLFRDDLNRWLQSEQRRSQYKQRFSRITLVATFFLGGAAMGFLTPVAMRLALPPTPIEAQPSSLTSSP